VTFLANRSTIYEVARRCGVSTATVSRVMHDGTGFSPATRKRVLAAAADMGWVPSGPARGLAFRKTGIVGLLFPDLAAFSESEEESPLYTDQVIRGAERAAAAAGIAVLIAATRGAGRKLARSVVGQVDGLVVLARSLPVKDIQTFSRSVPIVMLADRSNGSRLDYVGVDNRGGMRELTAHLLTAHRFTRLAFVGGPARSPDSQERFAGFRMALREARLPVPAEPAADGGFTEAGGARAMRTLLVSGKPPQAVLFGNDEMAVGGLAVLRAAGLRVPSGIVVTGFDDIALSRHVQPSLTTVRQPMRDLGGQAVRVLLARVAAPASRRECLVLPTQLVVRRSCGCPARREMTAGLRDRPREMTAD
jgi:LacI family transcriptional regulator